MKLTLFVGIANTIKEGGDMRHIAYIDITVRIERSNLQSFIDYMGAFKDEVEDIASMYGELLAYEIHEGDPEEEDDND